MGQCGPDNDPLRRLNRTALAPVLAQLAEQGPAMGLEPDVHAHLQPGLYAMAARMHVLAG